MSAESSQLLHKILSPLLILYRPLLEEGDCLQFLTSSFTPSYLSNLSFLLFLPYREHPLQLQYNRKMYLVLILLQQNFQ